MERREYLKTLPEGYVKTMETIKARPERLEQRIEEAIAELGPEQLKEFALCIGERALTIYEERMEGETTGKEFFATLREGDIDAIRKATQDMETAERLAWEVHEPLAAQAAIVIRMAGRFLFEASEDAFRSALFHDLRLAEHIAAKRGMVERHGSTYYDTSWKFGDKEKGWQLSALEEIKNKNQSSPNAQTELSTRSEDK